MNCELVIFKKITIMQRDIREACECYGNGVCIYCREGWFFIDGDSEKTPLNAEEFHRANTLISLGASIEDAIERTTK